MTSEEIIEAAERRGYERRVAEEKGYAEDSLRAMSDWLESGTFKVTFDGDTTHPLLLGSALYAIGKPPRVTFECKQAPPAALAVPLFLLHTGAVCGEERDDWEIEADNSEAVDAYCDANPGKTVGLYLATQAQQPAAAVPDEDAVTEIDAARGAPNVP